MKIEMIGMNTYPQSYFHIESLIKLEPIIPPFSSYMGYIHYYLHNIYYHVDLVTTKFHNMLKF
jgi:hypothetical protein